MLMLIHGYPGGHAGQAQKESTDEPAGHALGTVDTRRRAGFRLPLLRLAGGVRRGSCCNLMVLDHRRGSHELLRR